MKKQGGYIGFTDKDFIGCIFVFAVICAVFGVIVYEGFTTVWPHVKAIIHNLTA